MKVTLFAGAVGMCFAVGAADYAFTPTSADADWSNPANYAPATAVLPGAADTVSAPAATYEVTVPSASYSAIAGFRRIVPNGTKLVFNVVDTTQEYTNACAFSAGMSTSLNGDYTKGELVKMGPGTMVLAADGVLVDKTTYYDYYAGITVAEGVLKFPQYSSAQTLQYGRTVVSNGATLFTASQKPGGSTAFTALRALYGAGALENAVTPGSSRTGHSMSVSGNGAEASYFEGTIGSKITLYNQSGGGEITLTGRSSFGSSYVGGGTGTYPENHPGVVHVASIGTSAGNSQTALGTSSGACLFSGSDSTNRLSVVHFFGNTIGETSSREFRLQHPGRIYLDAGAYGGVTFTGNFPGGVQGTASTGYYRMRRLFLTGSNTAPCVVKGDLKPYVVTDSSFACTSFPTYVTKQGTGAWRFADRTSATGSGTFAIEDGALQFESIAEKGQPCALGLATQTTTDYPNALTATSAVYVPYAFLLGNSRSAAAHPVMEFVGFGSGATNFACTTRPIALIGAGGELRNSATNGSSLNFVGVSSREAGDKVFVVGGANTNSQNTISGVSDGAGKVSLVKTGSGTWMLTGMNDLSGSVRAEEGRLGLVGPCYTWFRFTIKQVPGWTSTGAPYGVSLAELALYDANGVRCNTGLGQQPFDVVNYPYWSATYARDCRGILPGQAEWDTPKTFYLYNGSTMGAEKAYDTSLYYKTLPYRLDTLFNDDLTLVESTGSGDSQYLLGLEGATTVKTSDLTTQRIPKLDDASSWLKIVMRLPDGSPEVASYDVCSARMATVERWPIAFTLEGSVDGQAWTMLDDRSGFDCTALTNNHAHCWYSDLSAFTAGAVRTGFPVSGRAAMVGTQLPNTAGISACAGGVVFGRGQPEVAALALQAADAGTLEGIALAANGKLSVAGEFGAGVTELPLVFSNVTGLANLADWTLKVNDHASSAYRATVQHGKLCLVKKGFCLNFR